MRDKIINHTSLNPVLSKKTRKLLLINPPKQELFPFRDTVSQPTGLLRIGAYFLDLGYDVQFIDCDPPIPHNGRRIIKKLPYGNFENEHYVQHIYHYGKSYAEFKKELLKAKKPDEIYVTSSMTYYYKQVHRIVAICKEVYPDVPVIVGGLYATLCPEHASKSKADKVFVGEMYKASDYPTACELLPDKPYFAIVKSSRGCPNKCSYCAVSILEGSKMRFRSPEAVVDEMEDKISRYGIKHFQMWESNLLFNAKKNVERMLDLIIEKKFDIEISFPEGLQPNLVYYELAKKMKKAGVVRFTLPLESADEVICKQRFHRPSGLSDLEKAVVLFKKAGYHEKQIKLFVLAGMPKQHVEGIVRSCIKTWSLGCTLTIAAFTPIPGTEEYVNFLPLIKDRDLDELHPRLWPCASETLKVVDLEEIATFSGASSPLEIGLELRGKIFRLIVDEIFRSKKVITTRDLSSMDIENIPYLISFKIPKKDFNKETGRKITAFLSRLKKAYKGFLIESLPRDIIEDKYIKQFENLTVMDSHGDSKLDVPLDANA